MQQRVQSELNQLEINIQEAKEALKKFQALERLQKNPDFTLIIDQGYLEEEASRAVWAKAEPEAQRRPEIIQNLDNIITAIGYLRQYFRTIYQNGYQAEKIITDSEQTRDELIEEEG